MFSIIKQIGHSWLIRQGPDLVIYRMTPDLSIYYTDIPELTPEIIYGISTKEGFTPTRDLIITLSDNAIMDKKTMMSYSIHTTNPVVIQDKIFTIDGIQIPILHDSPNCVVFNQPLFTTRQVGDHTVTLCLPYLIINYAINHMIKRVIPPEAQNKILIMLQRVNFNLEIKENSVLLSGGTDSCQIDF